MSKCTRCGKERIIKSSFTEKLEKSAAIIYTMTICPDSECQKIVENELFIEESRRKLMQAEKDRRIKSITSKRKN